MVRYNAYRIIHEVDVSHKSKSKSTYYIIMLTSENTAGSTNTAAENNCNSFILDNNRLSSCRYEIYEPITIGNSTIVGG